MNKAIKVQLALAATVSVLAAAPAAQAAYDPLASGTTKLTLDKSFLAFAKDNAIKLSTAAPATLKAGRVSFPVTGGKFDPVSAEGTVEHEGALLLKVGKRSIPIKAPQLKTTQRRAPFSAKVGGSQLKLAQAKGLEVTREGFADKVKVQKLTLSAKLATRLAKKLRLKGVFKAGQPFGSTLTKAQPQTITVVPKGSASLTLDPGIAAKLGSLFVALNPIFPAERPAAFTLPIAGGTIAPDGLQGTIQTEGSLEFLQLGGGQVFWAEAWLDLALRYFSAEVNAQPSPPYGGKIGRSAVAALTVPSVSSDPKARTVAIANAPLSLDPATAAMFNEVLARPQGKDGVFAAGEALGAVSFVAVGQ